MTPLYPFSALVGQASMKLALVLCAIAPRLGGVLLRGEKGTAKSTAAKALAQLVPNCPFRTLPLGATEDRLGGGLDLESTLQKGQGVFQPGLLAEVHGGMLYVDEINLLDDHLVDLLLDAAASGHHHVEREGLSHRHGSAFALVGSMNPEEGALRPQLLDRFGFCVEVQGETSPEHRVLLMERRLAFDDDPTTFVRQWESDEQALSARIQGAKARLSHVRLTPEARAYIGQLCHTHHVAGHRADLAMAQGACAHGAWQGKGEAEIDDVLAVCEWALLHRRRDALPPPEQTPQPRPSQPPQDPQATPPEAPPSQGANQQEPSQSPAPPPSPENAPDNTPGNAPENAPNHAHNSAPKDAHGDQGPMPSEASQAERTLTVGDPFRVKAIQPKEDRLSRKGSGRRQRTRSADRHGRYVRSRPAGHRADLSQGLALDATLRAAAPHQKCRQGEALQGPWVIRRSDWQCKVRERRTGSLILFVVDASGSMGARSRMVASKGAILSLLLDAYQKRDRVGLITFRRQAAEVLLPPTASIDVANRLLKTLPVGGRTPLAAGLVKAQETLAPLLRKEPKLRPLVVLVSDGRTNVGLHASPADPHREHPMEEACRIASTLGEDARVRWVVVDTEDTTGVRFGHARKLAVALDATFFSIEGLRAQDLVQLAKGEC